MIRNPIPWPNNAKCAVSISFDMDADSLIHISKPNDSFRRLYPISMGKYGPNVAIPRILDTYQKFGLKQSFFIPGWCIKEYRSQIELILKDGHEIACHYFYHDLLKNETDDHINRMLHKAKEYLEDASQTSVIGFRAPVFGISYDSPRQYKLIEEVFKYDSSFKCSNSRDVAVFKKNMGLKKLNIFPIYSKNIFGKSLRLGGTYLKLFPKIYSKIMINNSKKAGIVPHVYLHPYEFDVSKGFQTSYSDLKSLGIKKAIYWSLKQNMWLSFKNKSTEKKISSLIKDDPLQGTLKTYFK